MPVHEEGVRDEHRRELPRVVLGLERQPEDDPGRDRPADRPRVLRAPVHVDAERPHRHEVHVETREVRVEEDPRHEREEGRRRDAGPTAPRPRAEEVGRPHGGAREDHRREAERGARVLDERPLVVKVDLREAEQRFHQGRVLVIESKRSVDRALGDRLAAVLEEHAPPAAVLRRRVEVEALVAREADLARRREEPDHVRDAERRADGVIPPADLRGERHRVSASKQYVRRSPLEAISATRSTSLPS